MTNHELFREALNLLYRINFTELNATEREAWDMAVEAIRDALESLK